MFNPILLPLVCGIMGFQPNGFQIDYAHKGTYCPVVAILTSLFALNVGTLVICDEGHLLDVKNRGVGLELLLARFKSRGIGPPKFVFISAIVPNIEEINAWLGGNADTVIRSEYQPAIAEFSLLKNTGNNTSKTISLQLHPHISASAYEIPNFLCKSDFLYINSSTGRPKSYKYDSVKTKSIATARKVLPMGAVAVFAANKTGNQGAVGLAEELIKQLKHPLQLPNPINYVSEAESHQEIVNYFTTEYGEQWIGTLALKHGAVLHHGDIPQETREIIEDLVRQNKIKLAICTNTLAEGVNLPIRTLVLYSIRRRDQGGALENLLARDIKNLVGRAGRAGATTKGLVICANPNQWPLIQKVAKKQPGENITGGLLQLMKDLETDLKNKVQP